MGFIFLIEDFYSRNPKLYTTYFFYRHPEILGYFFCFLIIFIVVYWIVRFIYDFIKIKEEKERNYFIDKIIPFFFLLIPLSFLILTTNAFYLTIGGFLYHLGFLVPFIVKWSSARKWEEEWETEKKDKEKSLWNYSIFSKKIIIGLIFPYFWLLNFHLIKLLIQSVNKMDLYKFLDIISANLDWILLISPLLFFFLNLFFELAKDFCFLDTKDILLSFLGSKKILKKIQKILPLFSSVYFFPYRIYLFIFMGLLLKLILF